LDFDQELIAGRLLRRYKRFLADVELESGDTATVHCPNSGSMLGCLGDRWPVLLSCSHNPKRKYPLTWEMVHNGRCWIGINTHLANRLASDAISDGTIAELRGYDLLRREVAYGDSSRADMLLERPGERCYVEVKNVTMVEEGGRYAFPDAVTTRGQKHLRELSAMVRQGHRAVTFFVIQRSDGGGFTPAATIDPEYGAELERAMSCGVEVIAYRAEVTPRSITIVEAESLSSP
jgi:sugar fermentation stimulation protein A